MRCVTVLYCACLCLCSSLGLCTDNCFVIVRSVFFIIIIIIVIIIIVLIIIIIVNSSSNSSSSRPRSRNSCNCSSSSSSNSNSCVEVVIFILTDPPPVGPCNSLSVTDWSNWSRTARAPPKGRREEGKSKEAGITLHYNHMSFNYCGGIR